MSLVSLDQSKRTIQARKKNSKTEKHMKAQSNRHRESWAKGSLNLAEKIVIYELISVVLKGGGGEAKVILKNIKKKLENELGL